MSAMGELQGDENLRNLFTASLMIEEEYDNVEGNIPVESVKKEKAEVKKEVKEEIKQLQASEKSEKEEEVDNDIDFRVKTPAGKVFNIKQDSSITIQDLKEVLAKASSNAFEARAMTLIFKGKPQRDTSLTLKQVGVKSGSTLHMIKQLQGAAPQKSKGPTIEVTNPQERNFINITIPQGARPGNRLIIHPPGRSRMIVYVPRGHGPGDQLRVQLPQEPSNNNRSQSQASPTNAEGAENATRTAAPTGPPPPIGAVFRATCPENVNPGGEILVNLPGLGVMKVSVPANARAGEIFYFRAAPL